jgi:carbonic anhydrase/acetyltransferase-like protein (isoleucine patch superfamily)
MLIAHLGKTPQVHPDAYIAPNAVICGDVTIRSDCRILFGAQVIAEGGSIKIGRECIVMENAVLRAGDRHPLTIGNNCLIGPNAHVVGCRIEDEVFVATGAAIFHGAHLSKGSEVRVNAVVHLKAHLPALSVVPIGWVAVGDPVSILPPDRHEQIWEIQRPLNFPLTVYGIDRSEATMIEITKRLAAKLASHRDDWAEH